MSITSKAEGIRLGCTATPGELHLVREAGFDYVELPCRTITAMDNAEFRQLEREISRSAIPVTAMNLYCPPEVVIAGPGFDRARARDYAEGAAGRMAALGAGIVGVGSPRSRTLPPDYSRSLAQSQLDTFLAVTAEVFQKRGVTVCLEALGFCFCNFVNTLAEAAEAVSRVGAGNLALVLDFYNMEQAGEGDTALRPWLPLVRHAHLSDDDGSPSLRSYLHPQRFPVHRARLRRLVESGYRGGLTLETDLPMDLPRARESLAFLRETVGESRNPR